MENFEKQFNQPKPPEEKNPELKQEMPPTTQMAKNSSENLDKPTESQKEKGEKNQSSFSNSEELEKAGAKSPFKEELVDLPVKTFNRDFPEGYSLTLKQFESDPEKIVKISTKENIYRFSPEKNPVESSETLEIIKKSKQHYEELSKKYGIAITPFEYIIGTGEEEKEPVLYSVSDKIHGDNLFAKIKNLKSEENIRETENLLIALTNYFEDKFHNDNCYLGDVSNLSNYMYGRRIGENKDRIYLVDVEPVLNKLDSLEDKKFFYSRMKEVFYQDIEYVEGELRISLPSARKRYSDFIKDVEAVIGIQGSNSVQPEES